MSAEALRVLTVRQPWAWAIVHGGKARLPLILRARGRIGSWPVAESQGTRSVRLHASAGGARRTAQSAPSALPTLSTSPWFALRTFAPVATAGCSAPRARCLARSRASARGAQRHARGHGPRLTLTNGSAIDAGRGSSRSTASRPSGTTSCWRRKAASARSASSLRLILAGIECTLTTATTRAGFAAFSAARATKVSVGSETAWIDCRPPSSTCNRRSAALIGGAQ